MQGRSRRSILGHLALVGGSDVDPDQPRAPNADLAMTSIPAYCGLPDNMFSDSYFALPFVTLPREKFATWGEFWKLTNMWNDEPTDSGCEDHQRGIRYARSAIEAIRRDKATSRCLEITVKRMMEGAFRRRGPKGTLCRKLSSAEHAFLNELCRIAAS